jgi:hypothetical protein
MCGGGRRRDLAVTNDLGLPIVDGLNLPAPHRALLRPGELLRTRSGEEHRLPRYFYAVESAGAAVNTQLTSHFSLWEFMEVDLYEPALLRAYPRYIPCAITVLANALQVLRTIVGAPVKIAANGAYRSPAHAGSASGSPHCWGTAANIYRIGAEYLDNEERILRYSGMACRALAGCWTRPFGHGLGQADDHMHLDLGYVTAVPRHSSEVSPV